MMTTTLFESRGIMGFPAGSKQTYLSQISDTLHDWLQQLNTMAT